MKITVLVARYAVSGVPLAQIRLAKALSERGHEVDLVFGQLADETPLRKQGDFNLLVLGCDKVRHVTWPLVKYLRSAQPDVIFSAEDHLNTIVAIAAVLARSQVKISASSRVTPYDTYSGRMGAILKALVPLVMWRADVVTCVSEDMVLQYKAIFRNSRHVCVYNIADFESAGELAKEDLNDPWFANRECPVLVAAGQLGPWKGFSDLIKAISIVQERRAVKLVILGEGQQRQELQSLINKLKLQNAVRLQGNVGNPLKYFANADLFVLSSLLEGMPNVLIEAMMVGCTSVATDCPTGPRELLDDGRYGYLAEVEDPVSLATNILKALDNPIEPELLQMALEPFHATKVVEKHFKFLGLSEF
ncbi:MAG: glycosyltransferase [Pseudomonadota bacterium]